MALAVGTEDVSPDSRLQEIEGTIRTYSSGLLRLARDIESTRSRSRSRTDRTAAFYPEPGSDSPFSELIEAIATTPALGGTVPRNRLEGLPSTRFMVRVAKVPRPHRATKRNYNYFEELNTTLAAKGLVQDPAPHLSP